MVTLNTFHIYDSVAVCVRTMLISRLFACASRSVQWASSCSWRWVLWGVDRVAVGFKPPQESPTSEQT